MHLHFLEIVEDFEPLMSFNEHIRTRGVKKSIWTMVPSALHQVPKYDMIGNQRTHFDVRDEAIFD
jgi:hypothetical protein